MGQAYLYGAYPYAFLGGLNGFFVLVDEPVVFGLPREPDLPSRILTGSASLSAAGAVALASLGAVGLRKRRMDELATEETADGPVLNPVPPQ